METDTYLKEMEMSRGLIFEKGRLETYNKNWKGLKGFKHCTPENFSAAGFYNFSTQNCPDNVKCFSCQKELGDWEKDDDPWEEHVKRGKNCPFVIFKSKETTTIQDFLDLYYDTLRNLLYDKFEKKKEILKEKKSGLLEKINFFKPHKK